MLIFTSSLVFGSSNGTAVFKASGTQ
jgi:hypothetical protein